MGSRTLERSGRRVVALRRPRPRRLLAGARTATTPTPRWRPTSTAVLDALEHRARAAVGVSMGAHTALRFALERPAARRRAGARHARLRPGARATAISRTGTRSRAACATAASTASSPPIDARAAARGLARDGRARRSASGSRRTSTRRPSPTRSRRCRARGRSRAGRQLARDRRPDARRRQPRRGRPGASARARAPLRRGDPGRAPGRRGGGALADRLAGWPALAPASRLLGRAWPPSATGVGVFAAIAAGAVSFLSPCVLPLVPGYLSTVVGVSPASSPSAGARRVLVPSLLFIASFSAIFILLGLGATAIGSALIQNKATLDRVAAGDHRRARRAVRALGGRPGARARVARRAAARARRARRPAGRRRRLRDRLDAVRRPDARRRSSPPPATTRSEGHGALLLAFYSAGLAIPFLATSLAFGRMTTAVRLGQAPLRRDRRSPAAPS